jgi:hypothetical protein
LVGTVSLSAWQSPESGGGHDVEKGSADQTDPPRVRPAASTATGNAMVSRWHQSEEPDMADQSTAERELLAIAPLFFVADVAKAVAYYRDVLGFTFERIWGELPGFGMPHRDGRRSC